MHEEDQIEGSGPTNLSQILPGPEGEVRRQASVPSQTKPVHEAGKPVPQGSTGWPPATSRDRSHRKGVVEAEGVSITSQSASNHVAVSRLSRERPWPCPAPA